MQPDLPANPYARPLSSRAYVALVGVAVVLSLVVGLALTAERWVPHNKAVKEALAAFIAPYQELFLASLPGDDADEYVVFLTDSADPAQVRHFLRGAGMQRVQRTGIFPGTVVVRLGAAGPAGLDRLRAQPFVRLTVRNAGLFFCH
ncbi:MAG TPA: hypothetical protein VKB51_12550 [bacterium]|nr:hypothetical protein [bacterium]